MSSGTPPGAGDIDPAIETVMVPRTRDIGAFEVRRVLPAAGRRMVGPFIFLDQMGPVEFLTGDGVDVLPHPHIGLSTLTYLFSGEITHRDSTGVEQVIRPGEINWMTAGRGIVHSERTTETARVTGQNLFGLQCWVALPKALEETAPRFAHHGTSNQPVIEDNGISARVAAGSFSGARARLETATDTVFVDVALDAGATLPLDADHEERAVYLLSGAVSIGGENFDSGRLLVIKPGLATGVHAREPSRLIVLGGETMDGPRHIWWNFVSSSKERIEQAKADWKARRFDLVPGDADAFVPLPES